MPFLSLPPSLQAFQPTQSQQTAGLIFSGVLASYLILYTGYSKKTKKLELKSNLYDVFVRDLFLPLPANDSSSAQKKEGSGSGYLSAARKNAWNKAIEEVNKAISLAGLTCLSLTSFCKGLMIWCKDFPGAAAKTSKGTEGGGSGLGVTGVGAGTAAKSCCGKSIAPTGPFGFSTSSFSLVTLFGSDGACPFPPALVSSISNSLTSLKSTIKSSKLLPSCSVIRDLAKISFATLLVHSAYSGYHFYGKDSLVPPISSFGREFLEDGWYLTKQISMAFLKSLGVLDRVLKLTGSSGNSGKAAGSTDMSPSLRDLAASFMIIDSADDLDSKSSSQLKLDPKILSRTAKKTSILLGVGAQTCLLYATIISPRKNNEWLLLASTLGVGHFYLMEVDSKFRLQVRPYARVMALWVPVLVVLGGWGMLAS